ncbi:hypothetical protein [Microbacterium sp. No. 7]|uniref:hypothetical protein n=1 Tax=Microbacterium sp. No. 7 TaxID=1714373 RepID=UPI0006D062DC|nr:hypothetical protein [Microbacterium sp. No. 7]ALJ21066.1 hypothetical protein AOA12_14615 [Microbacterium sp. No. 7]
MTGRRLGVLHRADDGLVIGDPGRRHLLLTTETLVYREHTTVVGQYAWDELDVILIEVPTSRFRFSGVVAGLITAIAVALIMESPDIGPDDGTVSITSEGSSARLPLSRHHAGGYWERGVVVTQRLVDRLVTDPASRELLHRPDDLLRSLITAARR